MKQDQTETLDDRSQRAWKLLSDKDLPWKERHFVRNTFAQWGKENLNDIEFKNDYYVSTKPELSGYAFTKEAEVKFLNALHEFSPSTPKDKLIKVMEILMKLLDIESEWKF
jgi:hypothetical protein